MENSVKTKRLRVWDVLLVAVCAFLPMYGCAIHAWRVAPSEYTDEPIPSDVLQPGSVIYYDVPEVFEKPPSLESSDSLEGARSAYMFADLLGAALTNKTSFQKAILTSVGPEQGYYLTVDTTHLTYPSTFSAMKLVFCSITLAMIPCSFDDFVEYRVNYHLFRNGEELKVYQGRV